jgi:hypothetical protein
MKKLLKIAAICLPLVFTAPGFAQYVSDSLRIDTISGTSGVQQNPDFDNGVRYVKAPGGYIYNGPGFGGSVFVGPSFRQTNPLALRNENNGIEHGNNLGLFPSNSNLGSVNYQNMSTGTTVKYHNGTMLRKGTPIKLQRRTRRIYKVTPTSL